MQKAIIFGCAGLVLTKEEKKFFSTTNPWGFILFGRNIKNPTQLKLLTDSLQDVVGRNVPILIDQEGGRVERLSKPYWRTWMPPLEQMQLVPEALSMRAMWLRYRIIGEELKKVGINVNCAPIGDLANSLTHKVLLNRCYGDIPKIVIQAAKACANGLMDSGVLPVLKHIPGHGRADVDSHLELPKVKTSLKELSVSDFSIFKSLNDIPLGMTAHVLFEKIDKTFPATQSKVIIEIIRKQIGFRGLLMTDDLSMKALNGTLEEKVVKSLDAGCDLVLHCNGKMPEMIEIANTCSSISADKENLLEDVLSKRKTGSSIDIQKLINEYHTIIKNVN